MLQENHNWQHEVQFTFDVNKLSMTTGVFVYESKINQRLDLYDPIDTQGRFQEDADYSGVSAVPMHLAARWKHWSFLACSARQTLRPRR